MRSCQSYICVLFQDWQIEVILRKRDELFEICLTDASDWVDIRSRTAAIAYKSVRCKLQSRIPKLTRIWCNSLEEIHPRWRCRGPVAHRTFLESKVRAAQTCRQEPFVIEPKTVSSVSSWTYGYSAPVSPGCFAKPGSPLRCLRALCTLA